jgi:hypothetical protein
MDTRNTTPLSRHAHCPLRHENRSERRHAYHTTVAEAGPRSDTSRAGRQAVQEDQGVRVRRVLGSDTKRPASGVRGRHPGRPSAQDKQTE